MNSLIQSSDLIFIGEKLIKFANIVHKEKTRTTIINHFYEQLYQWAFSDMFGDLIINSNREYYICKNSNAARTYVALLIPTKSSTVKSIKEIKKLGEKIMGISKNFSF
jgi:small-conductance mechanosensitive channel